MLIEDPDAFKTWLTGVLKPICEADPGALAKYVIALVKKDKSPELLRESMISQLEVFLQTETEPFVKLLFKTLETQDYITPVIPNANPPNPNVKTEAVVAKPKEMKPIIPVNELPDLTDVVNGSTTNVPSVKKETVDPKPREERKTTSVTSSDEKVPSRRGGARERTRSRSWDRSRPRSPHREKRDRGRGWRNKSPPLSSRRYERSRRSRSLSRSPKPYRGRYRNRSPPPRSASRSRSPADRRRGDEGLGTPTQDSNHGDMDLRLTQGTQSIQSVVVGGAGAKVRCRDFDDKGYCMRGDMCPFDHGIDPVVLEDSALTTVLKYHEAPILPPPPILHPMQPRGLPPEYNPQAPQMWHRPGYRGPRPMLGPGPRMPGMGPFVQAPNMQRELISVPVMDNKQNDGFVPYQQRPYEHDIDSNTPNINFNKKKHFDFNRLGPRLKNPTNCSLELKKVPSGLNNITHLNNHFAKFGKIVNIQVCYEGDPEAAIVTFSSHAEANAAYRSTEAVLNNRFIKVFWHSGGSEGKQENVPTRSVKDRLGKPSVVAPNTNKVLNLVQTKGGEEASSTAENGDNNQQPSQAVTYTKNNVKKEEDKAQAVAAIKKGQEILAAKEKLKKNQEEKRKEALKITQNLRKRKQELLEKQLAQQKLLIDKLEKTPPGPQRDLLKQTIKKSQEAIEAISRDMLSQPATNAPAPITAARKSKEEAQKEMLDAELDLITKQQEGGDTSELQRKLAELRARLNTPSGRGRGAGRGAARRFNPIVSRQLLTKNNLVDNGAAKATFQKHTVDHRPTRLLISGYEGDEQDKVLTHFGQFGEIVDYVSDADTPSIVLNYKTRKEAEMAMLKGKHFQDRTLSITWCNNQQLNTQLSSRSSTMTVLVNETDEDHLINQLEGDEEMGQEISEELLLQDDEEEDDENEDRSWRR